MFKKVKIVGIEKKVWTDKKTKEEATAYYVHCEVINTDNLVAGHAVFSAKLDDECVAKVAVGKVCLLAYSSYNGYNKVVEVL